VDRFIHPTRRPLPAFRVLRLPAVRAVPGPAEAAAPRADSRPRVPRRSAHGRVRRHTGPACGPVMSSAMRSRLIRGAVMLGTVGIASAVYQVATEARDRRRFPPPGRLADAGGRFLHLLEAGTGSPAVVIVPAIGGNVLDWLAFHRELAKDVRVCVYDRAGFGWSDPPPRGRRTFDDMADELRQGLAGAGIGPPYLLAGHSIGGIIARRFAVRYRGDVAGMVLIESSHEDQARRRQADGWGRGAPRTLWYALRRRARILGLRRLAVQAGFSELNAEIARDIPARVCRRGPRGQPDRAAPAGRGPRTHPHRQVTRPAAGTRQPAPDGPDRRRAGRYLDADASRTRRAVHGGNAHRRRPRRPRPPARRARPGRLGHPRPDDTHPGTSRLITSANARPSGTGPGVPC
jgi:pimeloyl-ACP methyl ester carboxylesterase